MLLIFFLLSSLFGVYTSGEGVSGTTKGEECRIFEVRKDYGPFSLETLNEDEMRNMPFCSLHVISVQFSVVITIRRWPIP
jgi:hypothetical protein